MNPNHEVISDFLDGEAFEPRALGEALADPAGRDLLIDFVVLRYAAQADDPVMVAEPPARRPPNRFLLAAAAVLVALVGGYQLGQDKPNQIRRGRRHRRVLLRSIGTACRRRVRNEALRIALTVVLLQCAGSGRADAQVVDGLRIVVRVAVGRADGGDRRSTGGFVDPSAIGKTTTLAFSRLAGECGTGVSPEPLGDLGEASDGTMKKVYSAWTVQVTPTGRVGEAVTFRLQWVRSRDNGKPSTVSDDTELTLRPGQSLSLDVMPQSADASEPPSSCVVKALSLSVAVEHEPEPDQDRRLVAVDLWLVERLPDGKERSQPLSLRGLYNQPIPFYFDTLTESTKTLDVFGDLQISPGERTTEIKITTRSRVINLKPLPPPPGYPAGAAVASCVLRRIDNRDASTRARRGGLSVAPAGRQHTDRRRRRFCRAGAVVQNSRPPDPVT